MLLDYNILSYRKDKNNTVMVLNITYETICATAIHINNNEHLLHWWTLYASQIKVLQLEVTVRIDFMNASVQQSGTTHSIEWLRPHWYSVPVMKDYRNCSHMMNTCFLKNQHKIYIRLIRVVFKGNSLYTTVYIFHSTVKTICLNREVISNTEWRYESDSKVVTTFHE